MVQAISFPAYIAPPKIAAVVCRLSQRIFHLTLKYFSLLQSTSVLGFGLQEVIFGYLPGKWNWKEIQPGQEVICGIQTVQSGGHGLLYIASGTLFTLGEMEKIGMLALKGTGPQLIRSGWSFFLFANLFSLYQNIKLYSAAESLKGHSGQQLKISAALGILNHLGYIASALFSIFSVAAATAAFLGIFSILIGLAKFFFDYLAPHA